jgi:universal stress protein A
MTGIRRILHPTDFSRPSGTAFTRALDIASAYRAELLVAHVLSPVVPVAGEGTIPPNTWEQIEKSVRASAQKRLKALLARAQKRGVRATALLLEGAPHDAIVRAAKSKRADLVVLGTHGRTGLTKFLLGSVASRVVATAPCPVLSVRG